MHPTEVIDRLEANHKAILERFKDVLTEFGVHDVEVSDFGVVPSEPGVLMAKSLLEHECPPGQRPEWRCEQTLGGVRCGWKCE